MSDQDESAILLFHLVFLLHYTSGTCPLVRQQCPHACFHTTFYTAHARKVYPQEKASYEAQKHIRWVDSLVSSSYMGGENVCCTAFPAQPLIGVGNMELIRTSADSTFFFDLLKSRTTAI